MKVHEKIHTGERPHTCSYCEKRFTQLSTLNTHKKIHTENRPHCSFCNKRLTEKSVLKHEQSCKPDIVISVKLEPNLMVFVEEQNSNYEDEQKGNFPLEKESVSVAKEIISMIIRNVLKDEENIPIKEENVLMEEENIPIKEENFPMEQENIPIKEENIVIKKEDYSIQEENIPIKEENGSIKEEHFSIKVPKENNMMTEELILGQ